MSNLLSYCPCVYADECLAPFQAYLISRQQSRAPSPYTRIPLSIIIYLYDYLGLDSLRRLKSIVFKYTTFASLMMHIFPPFKDIYFPYWARGEIWTVLYLFDEYIVVRSLATNANETTQTGSYYFLAFFYLALFGKPFGRSIVKIHSLVLRELDWKWW